MVSDAATNRGVQMSFQNSGLVFFGCTPGSGVAGSYGSFMLNVLINLYTFFHDGGTRVSFPLHPHKYLLFLVDFPL